MSRPAPSASSSLSALRAAFPFASSSSSTTSSSSRSFHTSLSTSAKNSRRPGDPHFVPRAEWYRIREARARLAPLKAQELGEPDYVLGHIKAIPNASGRITGRPILHNPWEGCRLSKILVHPQTVWNSPIPEYEAGEKPTTLLPGLNESDEKLLFGALPHVSTALQVDQNSQVEVREEVIEETMRKQVKQTEMLHRILDLRNAGRSEINKMNRRRIIEEFGGGKDCGSVFVQVALLTMRIRGLNEHVLEMPKDIRNRMVMRQAIMDRAKHCRYIRKKWPGDYTKLLADVGLHPRTVEGELKTGL